MTVLHTEMFFTTSLPDNSEERFSLAEYLAWLNHLGMTVPSTGVPDLISWLSAVDNNLGRLSCWLSVQMFRQQFPENPAVRAAQSNKTEAAYCR